VQTVSAYGRETAYSAVPWVGIGVSGVITTANASRVPVIIAAGLLALFGTSRKRGPIVERLESTTRPVEAVSATVRRAALNVLPAAVVLLVLALAIPYLGAGWGAIMVGGGLARALAAWRGRRIEINRGVRVVRIVRSRWSPAMTGSFAVVERASD
jgi:hypothetical protein